MVAALLIAAFAIRLAYVDNTYYKAINDAGTYNRLGSNVAQYGDYHTGSGPRTGAGGSIGPTAYFPPAFPYVLGVVDLIDGHAAGGKTAVPPERVAQAVIGTVSVGLLGLVALEAFGGGPALAALAIAAAYPVFVELSGTLVAENLLLVFELAAIWTALRARRARHPLGGSQRRASSRGWPPSRTRMRRCSCCRWAWRRGRWPERGSPPAYAARRCAHCGHLHCLWRAPA